MSPPFAAGLAVYPYCAIRRIPFVVDAHTGAFLDPRWRFVQPLQRWLCRKAATTIITNTHLAGMIADFGADWTMLPDVPVKYRGSRSPFSASGFLIAVICSFDYDEPVGVMIETARLLPGVTFLVTGDPSKVEHLQPQFPPNLRLTGFLDNAAYGQLLRDANVVMALTTGKHKMLRAAYEAIYQGTPIIISDSPMLREEFGSGGILVDNTADQIAAAIRQMQENQDMYRRQALELRDAKQRRWEKNKALLKTKIGEEAIVNAGG
jgi:glycosyltransferase involved in cell wall biosynthesis